MTTKLSVLELKKLKDKLPRGYRKRVAGKVGLSVWSVDKLFQGIIYNPKIVDACIEVKVEEENRLRLQRETINQK
jgi:hypothetical protein